MFTGFVRVDIFMFKEKARCSFFPVETGSVSSSPARCAILISIRKCNLECLRAQCWPEFLILVHSFRIYFLCNSSMLFNISQLLNFNSGVISI